MDEYGNGNFMSHFDYYELECYEEYYNEILRPMHEEAGRFLQTVIEKEQEDGCS